MKLLHFFSLTAGAIGVLAESMTDMFQANLPEGLDLSGVEVGSVVVESMDDFPALNTDSLDLSALNAKLENLQFPAEAITMINEHAYFALNAAAGSGTDFDDVKGSLKNQLLFSLVKDAVPVDLAKEIVGLADEALTAFAGDFEAGKNGYMTELAKVDWEDGVAANFMYGQQLIGDLTGGLMQALGQGEFADAMGVLAQNYDADVIGSIGDAVFDVIHTGLKAGIAPDDMINEAGGQVVTVLTTLGVSEEEIQSLTTLFEQEVGAVQQSSEYQDAAEKFSEMGDAFETALKDLSGDEMVAALVTAGLQQDLAIGIVEGIGENIKKGLAMGTDLDQAAEYALTGTIEWMTKEYNMSLEDFADFEQKARAAMENFKASEDLEAKIKEGRQEALGFMGQEAKDDEDDHDGGFNLGDIEIPEIKEFKDFPRLDLSELDLTDLKTAAGDSVAADDWAMVESFLTDSFTEFLAKGDDQDEIKSKLKSQIKYGLAAEGASLDQIKAAATAAETALDAFMSSDSYDQNSQILKAQYENINFDEGFAGVYGAADEIIEDIIDSLNMDDVEAKFAELANNSDVDQELLEDLMEVSGEILKGNMLAGMSIDQAWADLEGKNRAVLAAAGLDQSAIDEVYADAEKDLRESKRSSAYKAADDKRDQMVKAMSETALEDFDTDGIESALATAGLDPRKIELLLEKTGDALAEALALGIEWEPAYQTASVDFQEILKSRHNLGDEVIATVQAAADVAATAFAKTDYMNKMGDAAVKVKQEVKALATKAKKMKSKKMKASVGKSEKVWNPALSDTSSTEYKTFVEDTAEEIRIKYEDEFEAMNRDVSVDVEITNVRKYEEEAAATEAPVVAVPSLRRRRQASENASYDYEVTLSYDENEVTDIAEVIADVETFAKTAVVGTDADSIGTEDVVEDTGDSSACVFMVNVALFVVAVLN